MGALFREIGEFGGVLGCGFQCNGDGLPVKLGLSTGQEKNNKNLIDSIVPHQIKLIDQHLRRNPAITIDFATKRLQQFMNEQRNQTFSALESLNR